jgi:hypothetical protein
MIRLPAVSPWVIAFSTIGLGACSLAASVTPAGQSVSVAVTPAYATVAPEGQQPFSATVSGAVDISVIWTVAEGATGGAVSTGGLYTAPSAVGTYHVVATSNSDATKSGRATVWVGTGPSVPSGPHPRLFMSSPELDAYRSDAATAGSPAERLVARCQSAINRGGPVGSRSAGDDFWPGDAAACAFAYQLGPSNAAAKTHAILNWRAALDDVYTLGANDGCTVANLAKAECVESTSRPACTEPVKGDTGYGMRWYGPFVALTYDWLHDAVAGTADDGLLAQTRGCLTIWMDNYDIHGYQRLSPGSNYHAGYMVGKVLSSIAIGADGGDGHLWTEVAQTLFPVSMVADGLAVGPPAGFLVGGDWGSWQYGPNSLAARHGHEGGRGTRAAPARDAQLARLDGPPRVARPRALARRPVDRKRGLRRVGRVPAHDERAAGRGAHRPLARPSGGVGRPPQVAARTEQRLERVRPARRRAQGDRHGLPLHQPAPVVRVRGDRDRVRPHRLDDLRILGRPRLVPSRRLARAARPPPLRLVELRLQPRDRSPDRGRVTLRIPVHDEHERRLGGLGQRDGR